jgi:signal transduction histidine kinase
MAADSFRTFVRKRGTTAVEKRYHLDTSVTGWMIRNKTLLICNSPSTDDRLKRVDPQQTGVTSLLAAPLMSRGELIGVLVLFNAKRPEGFSEDDGRLLGIVGSTTARVIESARLFQLEQEFLARLQAEKMASLGMVVAGVAHEIHSPLGALTSSHDVVARSVRRLKEGARKHCEDGCWSREDFQASLRALESAVQVFKSGGERMSHVVARLKAFVNLDESEMQAMDVLEALDACVDMLQLKPEGPINVQRQYKKIEPLLCFPAELKQVFFNVLLNASQAIQREGVITLSTDTDKGHVTIAVHDTGKGIASEKLQRVFDPGFASKAGRIGAALGLPICYQIVRRHRGTIEVDSEPGRGTTVTLRLPTNLQERLALEDTGGHAVGPAAGG